MLKPDPLRAVLCTRTLWEKKSLLRASTLSVIKYIHCALCIGAHCPLRQYIVRLSCGSLHREYTHSVTLTQTRAYLNVSVMVLWMAWHCNGNRGKKRDAFQIWVDTNGLYKIPTNVNNVISVVFEQACYNNTWKMEAVEVASIWTCLTKRYACSLILGTCIVCALVSGNTWEANVSQRQTSDN